MKKLKNISWVLILLVIIAVSCKSGRDQEVNNRSAMPNIIFVLADDMGYGDISALNPQSKINTPNLDRIAQEGMYFTEAHSPSAVCTPTRYGVLTGRYAFRTPLKSGVLVGHSPSLIEPGRTTVAGLLKNAGYQTACIGKWHLGLDWKKKDLQKRLWEGDIWTPESTENIHYAAAVNGGPNDHGFDYSYILPASLDMTPYCFLENQKVDILPEEQIEGIREGRGLFWRPGDAEPGFEFEQVLDRLISKTEWYLKETAVAENRKPFFLYLPLTAPHTPWVPRPEFQGKSGAGDYGDFMLEVDHSIGRILNLLDSLNLAENTLLMVTSDNGSHWKPEDIEQYDHRANLDYRGMKSDAWEGGHHVPLLARWPARIDPGSKSDQLVVLTDLMATAADLSGQELQWNAGEDSFSFLPALMNQPATDKARQSAIHHSISGMFALTRGDWKLISGQGSGGWSQAPQPGEPEMQLYNLAEDPGETKNLFHENPEVVRELQAELQMYLDENRSRNF